MLIMLSSHKAVCFLPLKARLSNLARLYCLYMNYCTPVFIVDSTYYFTLAFIVDSTYYSVASSKFKIPFMYSSHRDV